MKNDERERERDTKHYFREREILSIIFERVREIEI